MPAADGDPRVSNGTHDTQNGMSADSGLDPGSAGPGEGKKAQWTIAIEEEGSSVAGKKPQEPITVKFEDVRFKVVTQGGGGKKGGAKAWDVKSALKGFTSLWNRKEKQAAKEKELLHGVSGFVLPGEVLAVMGPSGGGKTTFLNVLGGRVKMSNVSGSVSFNDQKYSKALKRKIGFVTQDDVFYAHLTVRETLVFAAMLRLPKGMTRQQKVARADEVIEELGLQKCKDTIIGGQFLRGISGGERKRTSIGHEILINPSMLLLDEPTSGLDSTTALRIIQVLHNLARSGRTVVTTIHQPSSRLYHSFDKLLLLSEGNSVYFGKASEAMGYFERMGFVSEFATNPADFILDLANGTTAGISLPPKFATNVEWQEKPVLEQQSDVKKYLDEEHRRAQLAGVLQELHALPKASEEEKQAINKRRAWTAPWLVQFEVLWTRSLKERHHELLSPLRFYQVIALSLICGLLWFNSQRTTAYQLQDQVGFTFFLSIFWSFFPLFTAVFTFPQERSVLMKERAADMYQLSAYFMSRTLSDLPMELLLPTIFICISYFMANLLHTATAFFSTLFSVYLIVTVAQGGGFFLGASVMDVKKATTLASVLLLTFMLAGGYYLQSIPPYIMWVKYISFTWYAYRLLLKVQYPESETFSCGTNMQCPIQDAPALRNVPLSQGAWVDVLALLAQIVLYRALAYVALRRMKVNAS